MTRRTPPLVRISSLASAASTIARAVAQARSMPRLRITPAPAGYQRAQRVAVRSVSARRRRARRSPAGDRREYDRPIPEVTRQIVAHPANRTPAFQRHRSRRRRPSSLLRPHCRSRRLRRSLRRPPHADQGPPVLTTPTPPAAARYRCRRRTCRTNRLVVAASCAEHGPPPY